MDQRISEIEIVEATGAHELAMARRQREQFDSNSRWLQGQIPEVYTKHRGKYICIAGQQLFVAETAREAIALGTAAHPDDCGWFTRYIPKQKVARVYAV